VRRRKENSLSVSAKFKELLIAVQDVRKEQEIELKEEIETAKRRVKELKLDKDPHTQMFVSLLTKITEGAINELKVYDIFCQLFVILTDYIELLGSHLEEIDAVQKKRQEIMDFIDERIKLAQELIREEPEKTGKYRV
jgi:hypothetical protein